MNKLEKVLAERYPKEAIGYLARLLLQTAENGRIAYKDINIPREEKAEVLLLAYQERLLLPVRKSKAHPSSQWQDRILTEEENALYEMPTVIQHLIKNAAKKGEWDPSYAARKCFGDVEEEGKLVNLFYLLKKKSRNYRINSETIKLSASGLRLNINKAISDLKGCGLISPTLPTREPYPGYEINRSLY